MAARGTRRLSLVRILILALALASGRDLADMSVMPVIAARTVAVLSNAPALRTEPATAGKRRRNRPTMRTGDSLN